MTAWDPQQYLSFESERMRPAIDLLARVTLQSPIRVVDLGCGTGNVTRILRQRWPKAAMVGLDSSASMLDTARKDDPAGDWRQSDIAVWQPSEKFDLIYTNAVLHWLPNHERLLPRLMTFLEPGGQLAVQMPNNFSAPTHALVAEVARGGPWRDVLAPMVKPSPVKPPADYYTLLSPHCARLDIWETTYLQVLEGDNPVAEWLKGTWLKPFLDALSEPNRSAFESEYRRRIELAYPPTPGGKTLLPYRRMFIIAQAR